MECDSMLDQGLENLPRQHSMFLRLSRQFRNDMRSDIVLLICVLKSSPLKRGVVLIENQQFSYDGTRLKERAHHGRGSLSCVPSWGLLVPRLGHELGVAPLSDLRDTGPDYQGEPTKNPRMIQWPAIGIAVAVIAVALCCAAVATDLSASLPTAVDVVQYADFMASEILDVENLADFVEGQRQFFNRITPPGISWVQPMFPSVAPFDAAYFEDSFLDGLLGEDKFGVAVYPLSFSLDPKTRETLVYNADGKLILILPAS